MRSCPACRPTAHHRVIDVHVELERIGRAVDAERLHRKRVAFRQQVRAFREIEAFAMPLIDVVGPSLTHLTARLGWTDRVIADLGMTVGMLVDPRTHLPRQHLRAEADAEKRLLLFQRHREPVDLSADELVLVVGALRPTENDRSGVVLERLRQRVVETRATDVERNAAASQREANAPRRRVLLMQNDEDRKAHVRIEANGMPLVVPRKCANVWQRRRTPM